MERVEQGTVLVDQTGTTMAEVVAGIRRVTDLMGQISDAATLIPMRRIAALGLYQAQSNR